MARPSPVIGALEAAVRRLHAEVEADPAALAPPAVQLEAETAVAQGIAALTGERHGHGPESSPARPILARDLLLGVDLVLRALKKHHSEHSPPTG